VGVSTEVLIDDDPDLPHKLPVIAKDETKESIANLNKFK
jgi:hypothetical protein